MSATTAILTIIASLLAGFCIGMFIFDKTPAGTIRIDTSDPDDKPYLFLELKNDVNDLEDGDKVCFMVSTKNYISQE